MVASIDPPSCGFSGNSDLYGLGIRLGIYLQWITSQIAVYFHLEGSTDLSNAYFIFSISLMIALYTLTFQHGAYVIEIVVMFYMFWGGVFSVRGYVKRKMRPNPRSWRMFLGNATALGMGIYGAWFWIQGKSGNRFLPTPCGDRVFLFAKIPAQHFERVSIFFAFLSIYIGFSASTVFVMALFRITSTARRKKSSNAISNNEGHYSKAEWIVMINERAHDILSALLRYYHAVTQTRATSAYLEDIKHTNLVISTDHGVNRYLIHFQPPLRSFDELEGRLEHMYSDATIALREGSIPGESDTTSVLGRLRRSRRRWWTLLNMKTYSSQDTSGSRSRAKYVFTDTAISVVSACALIYSIIAVELTLKWNDISGVYTIKNTGQLIPFVIGAAGFLKVFWDVHTKYEERKREKKEDEEQEAEAEQQEHSTHAHETTSQDVELQTLGAVSRRDQRLQNADGRWL